MLISHLKKQAKNLQHLLPSHVAAYPDGSPLAACQELVAKSHGYPSFHALAGAQDKPIPSSSAGSSLLPRLLEDYFQLAVRASALEATDCERIWLGRALCLLKGVLPLAVHRADQGRDLDALSFGLESLDGFVAESFPDWVVVPLRKYLSIVPGYQAPHERGGASIKLMTIEKHEYIRMQIPCLRVPYM